MLFSWWRGIHLPASLRSGPNFTSCLVSGVQRQPWGIFQQSYSKPVEPSIIIDCYENQKVGLLWDWIKSTLGSSSSFPILEADYPPLVHFFFPLQVGYSCITALKIINLFQICFPSYCIQVSSFLRHKFRKPPGWILLKRLILSIVYRLIQFPGGWLILMSP